MAKKEVSARSLIHDIQQKAWEKVKDQPRRERGTKAEVQARALEKTAEKLGRSVKQLRDIESGKRPGANLVDGLKQAKRGRKVEAPAKDEKKVKARQRPEKTPPPPKPPERPPAEPPPPPPPSRVRVTVKGWIAPFVGDDEYLRDRRITVELEGDVAADFAELWNQGEYFAAQEAAVSAYFGSQGEGWLASTTDEPVVEFDY